MKTRMNWVFGAVLAIALVSITNFVPVAAKGDAEFQVSSIEEFSEIPGVIARPSGLLIKIIHNGDGGIADPNRPIEVHYEGRLADGTIFDSSYSRGGPAKFKMDAVIEGWKEAVMLMRVGSKWEIAIPYTIAYGEAAYGPVPAKADLFFTLELLGVE